MIKVTAFDGVECEVNHGSSILIDTDPTLNATVIYGDGVITGYGLCREAAWIHSVINEDETPYKGLWELHEDRWYIMFDREVPLGKRLTVYFKPNRPELFKPQ